MTNSKPTTAVTSETTLKPVKLYILLDRSGSMQGFEADVIGGFNSFKEKQRQVEGECSLTLVQFDGIDPFEVIYDDLEIGSVPDLSNDKYWPRDNTPLWDAVGRLITTADKRILSQKLTISSGYSRMGMRMRAVNTLLRKSVN